MLEARPRLGVGLDPTQLADRKVEVRFRRGGERCRPARRGSSKPLKDLLQEWGVPPWERDRLPLVYVDGELAAIADRAVCEPFAIMRAREAGLELCWTPS